MASPPAAPKCHRCGRDLEVFGCLENCWVMLRLCWVVTFSSYQHPTVTCSAARNRLKWIARRRSCLASRDAVHGSLSGALRGVMCKALHTSLVRVFPDVHVSIFGHTASKREPWWSDILWSSAGGPKWRHVSFRECYWLDTQRINV